jgi:hypothetical protein
LPLVVLAVLVSLSLNTNPLKHIKKILEGTSVPS